MSFYRNFIMTCRTLIVAIEINKSLNKDFNYGSTTDFIQDCADRLKYLVAQKPHWIQHSNKENN